MLSSEKAEKNERDAPDHADDAEGPHHVDRALFAARSLAFLRSWGEPSPSTLSDDEREHGHDGNGDSSDDQNRLVRTPHSRSPRLVRARAPEQIAKPLIGPTLTE
jgi:hypothetical protein